MTYAVFFDVLPKDGFAETYFEMAAELKPLVEINAGFISVERFQNLSEPDWYLSFSQWVDEEALANWRCQKDHHQAQMCGRDLVLEDYRLRVGSSIHKSEITQTEDRSFIFSAVGNADNIQLIPDNHWTKIHKRPRFFKGVINPSRMIVLVDFELESTLQEMESIFSDSQIEVGVFGIRRDYGMFDRAQAPGVFA
ncbi:antibiotic biosynthesis monooxygenase family protein [Polynucleobacter asymbioticus]|jgi:heme-degrading monooxygenase HmoA|uniref:antibiotic biosynthesis monooxygenase family protein n=1 Tax=Polynucleobacter asymbioticus TaxID=576611 RepID=UPI0008FBBA65|nr:antibiotic biosynthesis monooxygenase [Polynucleobacter asymbioticus]